MDNNSDNNSEKKQSSDDVGVAKSSAAPAAAKDKAVDQRQLREFNEWLARWINYQGLLAKYWKTRAQYEQRLAAGDVAEKTSSSSSKWDIRFQELCEYKNDHGNCNVPSGFVYKYKPPLGTWVKNMRRLKKAGKLEDDKVTRLTMIGFEFVKASTETIAFSAAWHASFLQLKAFKDRHGNIEVPVGYLMPNNKKLDQWIDRQRRLFRGGKLPAELINKLEKLDLNLRGRGRPYGLGTPEWIEKYKELTVYYAANGNCDVPDDYEANPALGEWSRRQRDLYKMEALPGDHFKKLTELGFNFVQGKKKEAPTFSLWATRVTELEAYKEANGHTDVPRSFSLNQALGAWVHQTRVAYTEGKLTDEQIEELEELGFEFKLKKMRLRQARVWERNFAQLADYKEKNNGSFQGLRTDNPHIGEWLKRQKRYYRENALKQDRFDRLSELGVTFNEAPERKPPVILPWETQYGALVEYKNAHGDTNVPSVFPENQSLYHWANSQRAAFRSGRLSEERIHMLTTIGFDFSTDKAIRKGKPSKGKGFLCPTEFDHYFQKLLEYKTSNGDVNVPQRYNQDRLGTFVHYMRLYYKTAKLSSSYISRLQEIGFDFDVQESLWNTRCKELSAYKEAHGDFFVPYADNPALHQWKNNQIIRYNKGNLPKEHTDKLLAIGFDFIKGPPKTPSTKKPTPSKREPPTGIMFESQENRDQYLQDLWESNYQKLAAIYEQRGSSDIPLKYKDDPSLGAWVFAQKLSKKKNKLSSERIEKLDMLGFKF